MRGIVIDGTHFNVPLVSIDRTADVLDKYANRTEDGDLKREILGVYYNYQVSFGTINDSATYNALFDKLTEPTEFHTISVPVEGGYFTFVGYISSVSDKYAKIGENEAKFEGLKCKFTAKQPTRR